MILPDGSTQLLALFGTNLDASPSPATHTLWAQQAGLNWMYLPLPCRDEETFISLCSALMSCPSFQGANITNPFKQCSLHLPRVELDTSAALCGAANTLYRKAKRDGSVWSLANTDLIGCSETLSRILRPASDLAEQDTDAAFVILGTGAMAETCAQAINLAFGNQQKSVTIKLSRLQLEAGNSKAFESRFEFSKLVVINTLPSGTHPNADALASAAIESLDESHSPKKYLFEVSYLKTKASRRAIDLGWSVTHGEVLFEEQARASFKLWAHLSAPTATTALRPSQE